MDFFDITDKLNCTILPNLFKFNNTNIKYQYWILSDFWKTEEVPRKQFFECELTMVVWDDYQECDLLAKEKHAVNRYYEHINSILFQNPSVLEIYDRKEKTYADEVKFEMIVQFDTEIFLRIYRLSIRKLKIKNLLIDLE